MAINGEVIPFCWDPEASIKELRTTHTGTDRLYLLYAWFVPMFRLVTVEHVKSQIMPL